MMSQEDPAKPSVTFKTCNVHTEDLLKLIALCKEASKEGTNGNKLTMRFANIISSNTFNNGEVIAALIINLLAMGTHFQGQDKEDFGNMIALLIIKMTQYQVERRRFSDN